MLVVDSSLAFGAEQDRVHVFDGAEWRAEFAFGSGTISHFFSDGERVGLILDTRLVYLRRGPGEWVSLPAPAQALTILEFGAFLSGERILLAGEGGATFGWTGEKWCDILTGIQRSARGIAVSPDRSTAFVFAFAENEVQRAPLVRITPAPK